MRAPFRQHIYPERVYCPFLCEGQPRFLSATARFGFTSAGNARSSSLLGRSRKSLSHARRSDIVDQLIVDSLYRREESRHGRCDSRIGHG